MPAFAMLPWRRILPGIGALLALYAAYSWAWQRGHDSRDDEVATITRERDTARQNVATLEAAIARQSAAIEAQARAGERVARASDKAIRSGAERRGALDASAARVEAVRPSAGLCGAVPGDVAALWRDL